MFSVAVLYPSPKGSKDNILAFLAFNLVQPPGDFLFDMLPDQHVIMPDDIA